MTDSNNALFTSARRSPLRMRRPVLVFWLIATGVEVLLAAVLLLTGGDATIARALEVAGLEFNTDLVTAVRLAVVYPAAIGAILLSLAQVAAPDISVAITARGVSEGPGSLRAVASRFRFWSREVGARKGLVVWIQMLLVFSALSLATAGINSLVFGPTDWTPPVITGALPLAFLIALFLDAGALFEESGWRGYALPLLLRRWGPVAASIVIGIAWAAWHCPVKVNAFFDYGPGAVIYLGAFTLKIVLLSIVMTYFWQRAGQATIIAIAMHGLSNDSLRLQGYLVGDSLELSIFSELTISAPLAVGAAVVIIATRGQLGANGSHRSVDDAKPA